jgi:uncharacterized membrane protein
LALADFTWGKGLTPSQHGNARCALVLPCKRSADRLAAMEGIEMEKDRLAAFSDGVIAVIITIMVLDLRPPHEADLGSLKQVAPVLLSYVLSFVYVAIYWNNHHFFYLVHRVNGLMLWANLLLLFWLSLIPFTIWMGDNHAAALPTAIYGLSC